jgi:threonine dehydrogenase-like Zn-dependent dehydrogenase
VRALTRRFRGPTSLAIRFPGPGQVEVGPERLRRPRRGEVLLDASCSLVSTGTERRCHERDFAPGSHWDSWITYPFRPGYAFVGVTPEGARMCADAPHAQRAVVAREQLIPVPAGVTDEEASWFAVAAIAQVGVAAAGIRPGDAVAVVGAGVVGQIVAQLVHAAGAASVIVVARSQARVDAAVAHGATYGLAADAADARDELLALTNGEGAAVVFDVTGSERVFADALRLARPHGTVVLLGDAGHPAKQQLGPELLLNSLRVVGAYATDEHMTDRRMADEFFGAVQDGSVIVRDLITDRVRPQDAPALYGSLANNDPARLGVLFDWSLV